MTLNPLKLLEEAINEHGSAVILKERLAQASEQYALLEKQLAQKEIELAACRSTISKFESDNKQLQLEIEQQQKQIDALKRVADKLHVNLSAEQESLLVEMTRRDDMAYAIAADILKCSLEAAKFHLHELQKRNFATFVPGQSRDDSWASRDRVERFTITQPGRHYLHSHGLLK